MPCAESSGQIMDTKMEVFLHFYHIALSVSAIIERLSFLDESYCNFQNTIWLHNICHQYISHIAHRKAHIFV